MKTEDLPYILVIIIVIVYSIWQIPNVTVYEVESLQNIEVEEVMRVTKYGATGNTMANGELPHEGACATSDRTIPFGTVIKIDGVGWCIVKDRTAKWVHKLGNTVDLYSNQTEQEMLEWGSRFKNVKIVYN